MRKGNIVVVGLTVAVSATVAIALPLAASATSAPNGTVGGAPGVNPTPVGIVDTGHTQSLSATAERFLVSSNGSHVAAPLIVGGSPTASNADPFEVSLSFDDQFRCGGNLIATIGRMSYIETNAHCVTDATTPSSAPLPVDQMTIGVGSTTLTAQTQYPVLASAINPDWDWGITTGPHGRIGDVALLKIPAVPGVRPVLIGVDPVRSPIQMIGWGDTTLTGTGDPSPVLEQLNGSRIANGQCADIDPTIGPGEECFTSPADTGPCFGDSGSAVLRYVAGRPELVGSMSRGGGTGPNVCGEPDNNLIATSTADYIPWMASVIFGDQFTARHSSTQDAAALAGN